MHSVLFVAVMPKERSDWQVFVTDAETKLKNAKGVKKLAENVWLLDLHASVTALGWLIALADRQGLAKGLLGFDREPEWLPAGFDPTPILGRNG